jgi:hypothetical protein
MEASLVGRWQAWVFVGALGAVGCGGSAPPAEEPGKVEVPAAKKPSRGLGIESEIGGLNEKQVQSTFQRAAGKLTACFSKGAERIPYLAGEIAFKLRINHDGQVRWAYVKESTLGDRTTEECMLSALKSVEWPKPEGGEGLAENSFTFEPGEGERPPVAWSPDQLGAPFKKARGALSQCRAKAGTGALKATLYVDTGGKAHAIGVASSDEKGEGAIACVIDKLKEITFPSPGSYASKVSVTIE